MEIKKLITWFSWGEVHPDGAARGGGEGGKDYCTIPAKEVATMISSSCRLVYELRGPPALRTGPQVKKEKMKKWSITNC